jgi:enoyl-CoA hydratase
MDYETILYEKQRGGVLITLNRTEVLNTVNETLTEEVSQALDAAIEDPEIRAIVITGAGRAFCAGMQMSRPTGQLRRNIVWPYGIPEGMSGGEFLNPMRAGGTNTFLKRWESPKPIIAAVNGWATGAGSWYALFAHMTYASEDAVFAQPEVRHGANVNFIWTLASGFKHSLRYGLIGDHIDAWEAERIGIVNKVVPKDQLLEECFSIVERISHISPDTVKLNLQVVTLGLEVMGFRDAMTLAATMPSPLNLRREEFSRPLDEAMKTGGMHPFLNLRDGPFQPEPFGPRAANPRRTTPQSS